MKEKQSTSKWKVFSFRQTLNIRIIIAILFITIFKMNASNYAQKTKITLDLTEVKLEQVFFEIKRHTEYNVLFMNPDVDLERKVTVKVKKKTVDKILNIVFEGTDIAYEILDKQIVLTKKKETIINNQVLKVIAEEQKTTITGIVFDDAGNPLPGAGVLVKGTTQGTETDFDGNYSIEVSSNAVTLVVSYLGFKTKEVAIGGRTSININLDADSASLDEVVVVGYGTAKKSDLTGALSSVSAKDFEKQPITRIDQAIQGRAAGVQVNQSSGAPGSAFKIRIRGANSISGNNNPLYLVDGIAVNGINSINANDIKSMEILKDASATAIYGSRGANGVVLISTKNGGKGKMKVNLESYFGVSNVTQKLDVMSAADFARGVNYVEGSEVFSAAAIDDLTTNGGEDWQGRLFRPANYSNQQLSITGGNEKVDYYLSGNYFEQEGTIINQDYKRLSLRSNINVKLTDKIKVGMKTFLSRQENSGVRANLATGMTWDPTTPAFNEDGDYNYAPLISGIGNGTLNPLVAPENNVKRVNNNQTAINGYMNYQLNDAFTFNFSGGIDRRDIVDNRYTSKLVNVTGRASVENKEVINTQITSRLTYTNDKNSDHVFKADLVYEELKGSTIETEAISTGFLSDKSYKFLASGETQNNSNDSFSKSLQSFLGRINYSLFKKYYLTASYRADGSSVFREGNRWAYYPSASLAWKVSEEDFMQNQDLINSLKARVSYGVTGNQSISARFTYPFSVVSPGVSYAYDGGVATIGQAPSNRAPNPDLKWEETSQSNFGIDVALWDSRVTLSVDHYIKNTTNLLMRKLLPEFLGYEFQMVNAGEIENKGFDVALGLKVFDNADWHISSNLSISANKNKVLSLQADDKFLELGQSYYDNTFPVNPTRIEVGKSISSFRGYEFQGVYQIGQEAEAAIFGRVPGDAIYKDVNEDGSITADDITTVGDGNPDYTWGWNWDVSYKNFDLNFLLLGSKGNEIYNFQKMRMMGQGSAQFHAVHADYRNRWTPTNPSNIPATRDTTKNLSSQFIEDGSYVTLKSIVLGYTLDSKATESIGLDNVRLFMNAENLFILTDYTGFDPESTASGSSDVDLGIDYNAYPINRSFSLGINVSF